MLAFSGSRFSESALAARRLCFLAVASAAFALPSSSQQKLGWSLHEFGERLLAQSAARGVDREQTQDIRAHLAPLHERIRVGVFELWLPKQAVDAYGAWAPAREFRSTERLVESLAELQALWLTRLDGPSGAAPADLAQELGRWAAQWRPAKRAASGDRDAQLHERVFEHLNGAPRGDSAYAYVLCLAPSRAQMCAIAGAHAALRPAQAQWIQLEWLRSCREFLLPSRLAVVSLVSVATDTSPHEMLDEPLGLAAVAENLIHNASHLITAARHASAPHWWKEGLAIYDTLKLVSNEDSLCSGAGEASESAKLAAASQWMFVMSRHKSRYRGRGAEGYFVAELRRARKPEGFELLDLDTNRPALVVATPHLGEDAQIPSNVSSAPQAVRKAYAEHLRAYSVAFLSYLDSAGAPSSPSKLESLSREFAKLDLEGQSRRPSLYAVARTLTGLTLGGSNAPQDDLEGAFLAWLAR